MPALTETIEWIEVGDKSPPAGIVLLVLVLPWCPEDGAVHLGHWDAESSEWLGTYNAPIEHNLGEVTHFAHWPKGPGFSRKRSANSRIESPAQQSLLV